VTSAKIKLSKPHYPWIQELWKRPKSALIIFVEKSEDEEQRGFWLNQLENVTNWIFSTEESLRRMEKNAIELGPSLELKPFISK